MIRALKAWRYRNAALYALERIFWQADSKQVRGILDICFRDGAWKEALEAAREGGTEPAPAAAFLTIMMIPIILGVTSADKKELALFAMSRGNEADDIANNFFGMVRAVRQDIGDDMADELYFTMIGSLAGYEGAELQTLVSNKLAELAR